MMTKTFAVRPMRKNKKNGWQIVYMLLGTYAHRNGYKADEINIEDGWFENREDAESEAMSLQWVCEDENERYLL